MEFQTKEEEATNRGKPYPFDVFSYPHYVIYPALFSFFCSTPYCQRAKIAKNFLSFRDNIRFRGPRGTPPVKPAEQPDTWRFFRGAKMEKPNKSEFEP